MVSGMNQYQDNHENENEITKPLGSEASGRTIPFMLLIGQIALVSTRGAPLALMI